MAWSPDVIAGVTIALILAAIGWGGTAYCWFHKKHVRQGDVSTVDKWLSKGGTTGAGLAGAQAGYAQTGEVIEMRRPGGGRQREGDLERGEGRGGSVVHGVDTTGELVQPPPPVYSEHHRHERAGSIGGQGLGHGQGDEVPRYHEDR